jgi:hypothetical protein
MRTKLLPGALLALVALAAVAAARAADPPVLRVIVVETPDAKAYRKELDKILALERTVVPEVTIRVWRARFAGAEAGTLIVASEMPNLAALAKIDELSRANSEFQAALRRLEQLRRIVSDSIYEEVGP